MSDAELFICRTPILWKITLARMNASSVWHFTITRWVLCGDVNDETGAFGLATLTVSACRNFNQVRDILSESFIFCRLQCPKSTYPPNISTPISWKYVHNRWNMHNSALYTEITRLNRLLPCRIFASALSYPPKVSTAPENKYLHHR